MTSKRIYVLAVNWGDGYERHQAWRTDEASARRYFADSAEGLGYPTALVHNGRILATRD